ncbi:dolichyl-diphosphooligosaccharide--protein glycosyltransferase subunit OST2, putative [Plasmodium berghei ANKA]|uniref:Dolichyl-diphosphooligosaccharide--protein glycosyltransferase subunit OST2, putative n=2 Tax=Plasmodium berghei TaxID=5821 RepID=A0A509AGQ9_PLABA|nr:dolichyl-diphosphooligosaccharide--protein glycosyltransferase subunit OST2, putative [Plasmodium berghei ANKA]VUC53983.1 dolichyl-diphosphooligosaccharide--protein glycosyltransferase subunit OST2, putative [Plasmodium berghei ANKA]|eukprot:XP_034419835.1 dolichyl-diphosphooligosaccharide--protein glycosyltransferase subunit OST2, putative [Plasmodium berghei ANKA]
MINNFYNKYMNITLKKIKFIDINIIFNLFNIILLSIYAFTFSLFKEKIANATIFTAIGNLTLLIALRVQITNKTLFNLKQEKIIFDFVICSLILYIGLFSYIHLN